jgi:hypothetical protein
MLDNHQLLPQYAERDPEEAQWHDDTGDQTTNCRLMWHSVDVISPSSWEPQEEGMISTVANFPSVRNQGLSVQEKAKLQKVMLASLVTLQQRRRL